MGPFVFVEQQDDFTESVEAEQRTDFVAENDYGEVELDNIKLDDLSREYNTYDEFASIFDKIGSELGDVALQNFHAHIAGIEYTVKGERHHLNLEESDMNYKDLLKAMKYEINVSIIYYVNILQNKI